MIVIGCSVNPELLIKTIGSSAEKPLLESVEADFTGSSVTAGRAALALNLEVKTFGLVGPNNSLASLLLSHALNGNGKHVHCLEVLDETSLAVIPHDSASKERVKVFGMKGRIVPEKVGPACEELRQLVADCDGDSIVALTGFREEERPFADVMLSRFPKGNRVLIPRPEFCPKLMESGLLGEIDCLVVNEQEFIHIGRSLSEIVNNGPRIVVVTNGSNGGTCFFEGGVEWQYNSHRLTDRESPGTGDWFLGAVLAFMDYHRLSFSTVTHNEFHQAVKFAAMVAGHKATMPGAKNGPPPAKILELLQSTH
ncbi:MAG: hypothetical protein V4469_00485 [Patescibacteria group bacterium]